jgi:hypothetical protein
MNNPIDLLHEAEYLVISKTLAQALDVPKSILLRRIAFWCDYNSRPEHDKAKTHYHDGKWWMYQSLPAWEHDIAIYSERTIQRALADLEALNLILADNFNKLLMDRTKWYTVNEEAYIAFMSLWRQYGSPIRNGGVKSEEYIKFEQAWAAAKSQYSTTENFEASRQSGMTKTTDWHEEDDNVSSPIPVTNTVKTTENYTPSNSAKFDGKHSLSVTEGIQWSKNGLGDTNQKTDKRSKSTEEEDDPSNLPQFIQHFLAVTKMKWKNVSPRMRELMHANLRGFVKESNTYESTFPSVIEMYNEDRVFAAWIRERVTPEAKANFQKEDENGETIYRAPSPKNFLDRCRNYYAFQQWLKTDVGMSFAKRVQVGITSTQIDIVDIPPGKPYIIYSPPCAYVD